MTQCHAQRSAPILRRNGPTCPDARGNVITMTRVSNSTAATLQGKDAISQIGAQTGRQLPARSGRASAACSWPHRPKRSLPGCADYPGRPEAWLQVVGSYRAVGKVPHRQWAGTAVSRTHVQSAPFCSTAVTVGEVPHLQWAGTAVSRTHAQSEPFCSTALPCHTHSRHQGGWRKGLKTGKGAGRGARRKTARSRLAYFVFKLPFSHKVSAPLLLELRHERRHLLLHRVVSRTRLHCCCFLCRSSCGSSDGVSRQLTLLPHLFNVAVQLLDARLELRIGVWPVVSVYVCMYA